VTHGPCPCGEQHDTTLADQLFPLHQPRSAPAAQEAAAAASFQDLARVRDRVERRAELAAAADQAAARRRPWPLRRGRLR